MTKLGVEPSASLKDEPVNAEYNRGWKDGYKQGAIDNEAATEAGYPSPKLAAEIERLTKVNVEPVGYTFYFEGRDQQLISLIHPSLNWKNFKDVVPLIPASALAAEQAKVRELVEVLKNIADDEVGINICKRIASAAIAKYGE